MRGGERQLGDFVDVFPAMSRRQVLRDSVATGDQQILFGLGSNWWVQTDGADVQQVRKILGGTVVPGVWHPDTGN